MVALLSVLLLGAAPGPERAAALAAQRSWDELYLAYSAVDPKAVERAHRPRISAALRQGCEALLGDDAVMAYSLGEKAAALEPTAPALLCAARAAKATQQRTAAERALRQGLALHPREGRFGLELGRLLLEEQDPKGAAAALGKVPRKSGQYAEAQALLQEARGAARSEQSALDQAQRLERSVGKAAAQGGSSRGTGTLTYESSEASGWRARANSRFRFVHSSQGKDFGQRAEYEGKVAEALDEAWESTRRILGRTRQSAVEVILYSREEFRLHHGADRAHSLAGFYSNGAIRLNDAAELTADTRATLVHEYVHATVDELAQRRSERVPVWLHEGLATYVEWRHKGGDGPPLHLATRLRDAGRRGALPRLAELAKTPLSAQPDAALRYGLAGLTVKLLVERGGMEAVVGLVETLGAGQPLDGALQRHFGLDLGKLDQDVRAIYPPP